MAATLTQPLSLSHGPSAQAGEWVVAERLPHALAVVLQRERHIRPRQRDALEGLFAPGELGALALQELAPCRGVEIQLAHLDAGAVRVRGRHGIALRAVHRFHLPGMRGLRRAAGQRELRHGGHAGQRLTAEAHAGDALQVIERRNLAGGMAHQRQWQLLRRDAATVVAYHQSLDAAAFQLHGNLGRARVQAVFQQLF